MRKVSKSNILLQVAALIIAIFLWLYVHNEQNPLRDQVFNVPLKTINQPREIIVRAGLPSTVSVKVRAKSNMLGELSLQDLKAYVDLTGIKPDTAEVPVQVEVPPGVRVVQVNPSSLHLSVDRLAEKEVPVVVVLKGSPLPGYQAGTPRAEPERIVLRGPASLLEKIDRYEVSVDLQGASSSIDTGVQVNLLEGSIIPVTGQVRVTVPIALQEQKAVPVKVQLTGKPAEGFTVSGVILQPETVTVFAPAEVLTALSAINLGTVDVSGAVADVQKEIKISLPSGVSLVKPESVRVQIAIRPVPAGNGQGERSSREGR